MPKMFNPAHPGALLREDILPSLHLTVTEAAAQLGIARTTFSRLLNERIGISPEMALRLEAWLGAENGNNADFWLALQTAHDLWHARKRAPKKVRPVVAGVAA